MVANDGDINRERVLLDHLHRGIDFVLGFGTTRFNGLKHAAKTQTAGAGQVQQADDTNKKPGTFLAIVLFVIVLFVFVFIYFFVYG